MTLASRSDPYRAYNFLITLLDASAELTAALKQIARMTSGGFSECSGLESTIEIEEWKEGGNNGATLKFPTRGKTVPLVLKRGVTTNDDLWRWHNAFLVGRGQRRDGLIVLHNELREPVKAWAFHRGIPTKYSGPTLNAADSAIAVEQLEITHEGLALISPVQSISSIVGAVASSAETIGSLFD